MDNLPISEYQQQFFLAWALAPNENTYNVSLVYKITGKLDKIALKKSCEIFIKKHDVVHARYNAEGNECYYGNYAIDAFYHESVLADDRDITQQIRELLDKPFDLTKDVLFKIYLLFNKASTAEEYFFIVPNAHHIIADGEMAHIILTEIACIYNQLIMPDTIIRQTLREISFGEAVKVESNILTLDYKERAKQYWLNFIGDIPLSIQLPYKSSSNREHNIHNKAGEFIYFELDEEEKRLLRQYAKKNQSTLFIVLAAIYGFLIVHYSGQMRILLSYPINMRPMGYKNVSGSFINNVPLKIELDNYNTFEELVTGLNQQRYETRDYQGYSLTHIMEDQRKYNHQEAVNSFNVGFSQTNLNAIPLNLQGVETKSVNIPWSSNVIDELCLRYDDRVNYKIQFKLEYRQALFDPKTMSAFVISFKKLVTQLIQSDFIEFKKYCVLNPTDYATIIYQWNKTKKNYPTDKTIHQLFQQQVKKTPHHIAVVYKDKALSYDELNVKTNQLAHYLRDTYSIQGDDLIALCLDRSEKMLIAILAVLKAGAGYVPIDPNYSSERIIHIIGDTQAKAVIVNEKYVNKLSAIINSSSLRIVIEPIDYIGLQNTLLHYPCTNPVKNIVSSNLAYVIYTSGTTGKPKGVMIEHKNIVSFLFRFTDCGLGDNLDTLATTSYVFDIFSLEYGLPLLNGYKLELFDLSDDNLDPMQQINITDYGLIQLTPSKVELLVNKLNDHVNHINPQEITLLLGGEALNKSTLNLLNTLQNNLTYIIKLNVINVYGPTETTVWSTYKHVDMTDTAYQSLSCIGVPLANETAYILDNHLNPLPIGAIGELYIGGVGVARGYLNLPELTAERFITNPFQTQAEQESDNNAKLYKTGDLVRYLSDGHIEFIGRNDFQVKIRGFRIELDEIENALADIPSIKQNCVVVKERITNIGNIQHLIGYYVLDNDFPVDDDKSVINQWAGIYDDQYSMSHSVKQAGDCNTTDFTGWNSFITSKAIPIHEMEEWRNYTVNCIRAINPANILEIGVGSGLLMYPLLESVRHYVGLDISSEIIDRHKKYLKTRKGQVDLYLMAADQVDKIYPDTLFDCIVMNSVCQYFPGIHYFAQVLDKTIKKLNIGGSLLIGDVRNYHLHQDLIKEKLLYEKGRYTDFEVEQIALKENEFLIAPEYFLHISEKLKHVKIDILKKPGSYCNELTEYRYDVLITRTANDVSKESIKAYKDKNHYYNTPYLQKLSRNQILANLSKRLPEHMIPNDLVELSRLPLTINGKLDRKALPDPEFASMDQYVAPRNELEQKVCAIYAEILGLSADQVGIRSDFFYLGGNSILAIKLVNRLNSQIFHYLSPNSGHPDISVADIFKYKTITNLLNSRLNKHDQTAVIIPRLMYTREQLAAGLDKVARLSFAQERLWFIENYVGGSNVYHIPLMISLAMEVNLDILQQSLIAVITRHEILHSIIKTDSEGNGYQQVGDVAKIPMIIHYHPLANEAAMNDFIQQELNHMFSLDSIYPIRISLLEPSWKKQRYLLIVVHHIAFDGWSIDVFMRDLKCYYDYYLAVQADQVNNTRSAELHLLQLTIQYKDFAVWQRSYVSGDRLAHQLHYWKTKLIDYECFSLPTDKLRPPVISYAGDYVFFSIHASTGHKLRKLAKQCGVSLYSVLLSGFNLLLQAYSHQNDIVIGTPIANRHHQQLEDLIGCCVNSLPLRSQIDSNKTIVNYIKEVGHSVIEAQLHQDLPFEKLITELNIAKDPSRHPLFQIMFGVQSFGNHDLPSNNSLFHLLSENIHELCMHYKVAKFDLTVILNDSQQEIVGNFNYATSLFTQETIESYLSTYKEILNQLAENSQQKIADICYMNPVTYQQTVYAWNQTAAYYPQDKTIQQLFEEQVEKTPDQIAVVYEETRLSYRALNSKANQLAHYLQETYSIKGDDLIVLCLDRSEKMPIAILAVLKAGAAYVPMDPRFPEKRLGYILADVGAKVVLTNEIHRAKLSGLIFSQKLAAQLEIMDSLELQNKLTAYPKINLLQHITSHHLAYILYTSGTTGKPKGVMIEHQSVVNLIITQAKELGLLMQHGDHAVYLNCLWYANYVFDAHVWELFTVISCGHAVYVASDNIRQDIELLSEFIHVNKICIALLTPALLTVDTLLQLKTLVVSGDKTEKKLLEHYQNNQIAVINAYGPTESTVYTTLNHYKKNDLNTNIGKPIPNTTAYVLDSNNHLLPVGAIGELHIGGVGLARGYLNFPELTAERFIANPFQTDAEKQIGTNARLYKTGDLVRYLPNGDIEYMGRNDFQVKIRGLRIELGEIETKLADYPGVKQAIVLAKERQVDNDNSKYLAGYYVSDHPLNHDAMLTHVAKYLPEYMTPSVLVWLNKLPLTINDKLDRKALPDPTFTQMDRYVAPRNDCEQKLCALYAEVLGLAIDQVGIHDDFFRLGGDSILAIKLISQMNTRLFDSPVDTFKISVASLFKHKSIANLYEGLFISQNSYQGIYPYNKMDVTLPTLIFVHPGHGGSEVYQRLAGLLSKQYNCIGIDNYNIHHATPITGLTEIANYYLTELLKRYELNEPLYLAGWSLGGQIALEMASLMEKRGYAQITVICFDTILPDEVIHQYWTQSSEIKMQTMLFNELLKRCSSEYANKAVNAFSAERQIALSRNHCLANTKVILYKASHEDTRFYAENTIRELNRYVLTLPKNNIDKICDAIKVINLSCHHANILETVILDDVDNMGL